MLKGGVVTSRVGDTGKEICVAAKREVRYNCHKIVCKVAVFVFAAQEQMFRGLITGD